MRKRTKAKPKPPRLVILEELLAQSRAKLEAVHAWHAEIEARIDRRDRLFESRCDAIDRAFREFDSDR